MAGPLTNPKDLKDIAGTGGDDSSSAEKKANIDCTVGNDSGLGEDAFPSENIVATSGLKLMFRCKNRYFSIVFIF